MEAQHELKIVGVHYAVNPNYQEMEPAPEMEERTIEVLKNLNETLPRVVLMPEPTNPVDQLAVMARVRGKRIGYVSRFHLGAVHRILKQTGKPSSRAIAWPSPKTRPSWMRISSHGMSTSVGRLMLDLFTTE